MSSQNIYHEASSSTATFLDDTGSNADNHGWEVRQLQASPRCVPSSVTAVLLGEDSFSRWPYSLYA